MKVIWLIIKHLSTRNIKEIMERGTAIYDQLTIYEQLVEEMENRGFVKEFSKIDESYVEWSDDDEAVYIRPTDCDVLSIKGIRESRSKNIPSTKPHHIYIKIYDYNREDLKPEDAVRFSIIEEKRVVHRTDPDAISHTVYYHYPYKLISSGKLLGFKKGIMITDDKKLEIKIIRNSFPIKIGKLELEIECDKWWKKEKRKIIEMLL